MKKTLFVSLMLITMLCMKSMAMDSFEEFQTVIENPQESTYYDISKAEVEDIIVDLIHQYQGEYKRISTKSSPFANNCAGHMPKKALQDNISSIVSNTHNIAINFLSDPKLYRTWAHAFTYLPINFLVDIRVHIELAKKCGVNIAQSTSDIERGIKTVVSNYIVGDYETEAEKGKTVGFIAALDYYIGQMPRATTLKDMETVRVDIMHVAKDDGISIDENMRPITDHK